MQTCCEILCMWPFVNACHDQSLISLSTKEPGLKIPVPNFFIILLKPFQNLIKSCKFVCLFNWTLIEKDEWSFVNACHDQSLISLSTKELGLKIPVPNFFTTLLKPFQNFIKSCKFVCLFNWKFWEKDKWPFVNACHDQSLISLCTKEPSLKIPVPDFYTTRMLIYLETTCLHMFILVLGWDTLHKNGN